MAAAIDVTIKRKGKEVQGGVDVYRLVLVDHKLIEFALAGTVIVLPRQVTVEILEQLVLVLKQQRQLTAPGDQG